jgi:hypothetical protein
MTHYRVHVEVASEALAVRYFLAASAFLIAAHLFLLAWDIFLLAAAESTLFLAGAEADLVLDDAGAGAPERRESRIFWRRSISLLSSATAACMLMLPPRKNYLLG